MEQCYVQAFAALNKTGMYSSSKGYIPWEDNQDENPLNVRRKQVCDKLFTGFGKLNAPDKLAFSAASLIFSGFLEFDGDTTGISLGTTFGCLSTDLRYAESVASGFPSPTLFTATLPSSPIADIAIMFKLKGPDRTVADTTIPGFLALDNAMRILSCKKAESMVALLVNGIEPNEADMSFVNYNEDECNFSYAFMLASARSNTGLNYTISLEMNARDDNYSRKRTEGSYFLEMIKALIHARDYSSPFEINGTGTYGSITLKKDG